VLRWRLAPGNWQMADGGVTDGRISLRLRGPKSMALRLVEGRESRRYLESTTLPVLEAEISVPATITTEIAF